MSHNLIYTKLGKKEKEKKKEKKRLKKELAKVFLNDEKLASKCKSSCCEKYKKSEKKRCGRCPMFDLIQKAS